MKLFRYSGSKESLLHLYPKPPASCKRIVEPYLGSGCYGLHYSRLPVLGYEINPLVYRLWKYLQKVTPQQLKELDSLIQQTADKTDVRQLKLKKGPQTYVRLNVCSLMVGQLTSWGIYRQHNLPIDETIKCLPQLHRFTVINDDGATHVPIKTDLLFVDPPYIDTIGGYKSSICHETTYDPASTIKLVDKAVSKGCSVIFTYGSNAKTVFPDYKWVPIKKKSVSRRSTGTTDRTEYVAVFNMRLGIW